MDSATAAVTIVSIVMAKGCGLLGLWLRLRWRAQQEQARQRCLAGVLGAAPVGGLLEFETAGTDGHRLRMRLRPAPGGRGGV
ncbi:hypothetical protein [Streptomyces hundungensis]|uniref:hypothetical protein n=1 Tax=Streptomyces hundungensis TaxID=1077946 RepID=UPI0031EB8BDF